MSQEFVPVSAVLLIGSLPLIDASLFRFARIFAGMCRRRGWQAALAESSQLASVDSAMHAWRACVDWGRLSSQSMASHCRAASA